MPKPVVRAAIHPAIGVARVGSSQEEFLLAPQVPFPSPRPAGSSHDAEGRLKREAVEFRVYGYDEDGKVVAELNVDNAEIRWTVHVANVKSGWYKFRHAMDLDTLADTVAERRNPSVVDPAERRKLLIDPGPRTISGCEKQGPSWHFESGTFKGTPVYLGELRTDRRGRLLFLSGRGVSRSPSGAPTYVDDDQDPFGNAADWHDDICDGPVEAHVVFEGRDIPTDGAWVASAPPSYAPDLKSWRTLYDLLTDVNIKQGWTPAKQVTSFSEDIYPIFARLSSLQWVNKAMAALFGHGAPFDFADPGLLERISDVHGGASVDVFKPLRIAIARFFRQQDGRKSEPTAWPWLYGDAYDSSPLGSDDPHRYLALDGDGERARHLTNWVEGRFEADWGRRTAAPALIDDYPLAQQPGALDRAALDFCAADAFHPGIELTWPMRHTSMYWAPFRIRRATSPEPDYGPTLDVPTALSATGPLHGQFPGSLTRWMLLPWQVDTGGCLAGYDDKLVYDAPSFWPTRVPNFILSGEDYARASDATLSSDERHEAFQNRRSWFTPLGMPAREWGQKLVTEFGAMGVIEAKSLPDGSSGLPTTVYAETLTEAAAHMITAQSSARMVPAATTPADQAARDAGFADEADRRAVRAMRFGH